MTALRKGLVGANRAHCHHHLPFHIEHCLKSIADAFLWKVKEERLIAPFLKISVLGSNRKLGPKAGGERLPIINNLQESMSDSLMRFAPLLEILWEKLLYKALNTNSFHTRFFLNGNTQMI